MANLIDYVKWRGDLNFKDSPFNEIDNAVLSFLAYVNFDHISQRKGKLGDVCNRLLAHHEGEEEKIVGGLIVPKTILDLFKISKDTVRFGNIKFSDFVNHISIEERCQFSACTFHLSSKEMVVVFRGTDDTTIGWQENLDMIIKSPIMGEIKAKEYLERIAQKFPNKKIWVCGHSKGGHLSTYASIYASDAVKKRIIQAYSNDGPGFLDGTIDSVLFEKIKDKITLIIPNDSIVGLLFNEMAGKVKIVIASKRGPFQHDMYTWEVEGTKFCEVSDVMNSAKKTDKEITELVDSLNLEERVSVASDIYTFITESKIFTLQEGSRDLSTVLKYLGKIKYKNKKLFFKFFRIILTNHPMI